MKHKKEGSHKGPITLIVTVNGKEEKLTFPSPKAMGEYLKELSKVRTTKKVK
jgi:hypothetical protein